MTESAPKIVTYEDLYTIPENMIGEIINGELVATPRPSVKHSYTASTLAGEIIPTYHFGRGGPGGWIILNEPEIAFGGNIIVPDLAGWKNERFPAEHENNWIAVVPDWVCEIISPSSASIDRVKKMGIYALHKVPYYWIIDPAGKTLEVLKNEESRWAIIGTYSGDEKVKSPPFQEVEIDLSLLWLENAFRN